MKTLTLIIVFCVMSTYGWSQNDTLIQVVKNHPIIGIGGAEVISCGEQTYIVGVGFVENKGQSRSILERIGKIKAEKEVTILVNGSDFTSSAMAIIEEVVTTNNGVQTVEQQTTYFENIRENSEGYMHSMKKLESWKSEDKSMFYFAIYKPINFN
ncbi:MAG: hypothetical protein PF450_08020 [Bacteroidales bacterium]|nr:hypothetical protein [Bacteroidales bacterium]